MELSRRLDYLRKISAAGLIALAAWASLLSPAQAKPSWASLGPADFPTRVNAIVFPSGNRIDSSSGVCWGKWCVGFGSERPEAHLTNVINIWPLECENSVVGVKECTILLIMEEPRGCLLHIRNEGKPPTNIDISCPSDLRLE